MRKHVPDRPSTLAFEAAKEIVEFQSGKAEGFKREGVIKSAALTDEQREILEKRGVLSPEEIHKLASKTKRAVLDGDHASCHSDLVDSADAEVIQNDRLIQLRTKNEAPAAE